MIGAAVQPWVPRWVAIPLAVLWAVALVLTLVEHHRAGRPRTPARRNPPPAAPPVRGRPYDWKTDDPFLRQPTHVHRRVS